MYMFFKKIIRSDKFWFDCSPFQLCEATRLNGQNWCSEAVGWHIIVFLNAPRLRNSHAFNGLWLCVRGVAVRVCHCDWLVWNEVALVWWLRTQSIRTAVSLDVGGDYLSPPTPKPQCLCGLQCGEVTDSHPLWVGALEAAALFACSGQLCTNESRGGDFFALNRSFIQL